MLAGGDRVKETSTGTGPANLTLAGAPAGFVTFNSFMGLDIPFSYWILHDTDNTWEHGLGHLSAPTTFVRDKVIRSTSADAAVNFASGGLTLIASPGIGGLLPPIVDDNSVIITSKTQWFTAGGYNTTGGIVEGRIGFYPWIQVPWIPNGFDNFGLYGFSTNNYKARVGLYTAHPATGLPHRKLWQSNEITVAGSGHKSGTIGSTIKILPGHYWMAVGTDDDGVNAYAASVYGLLVSNGQTLLSSYQPGAELVPSKPTNWYDTANSYVGGGNLPNTTGALGETGVVSNVILEKV